MTPRHAFILGAGFTKAFVPNAPLLIDDYSDNELRLKFAKFEHARGMLEAEVRDYGGKINLERLMTRLEGGMPYDWKTGADTELAPLSAEIKKRFIRRIAAARQGDVHWDELNRFARYCKANHIDCITFNYDDFLDQALWATRDPQKIPEQWWTPNWGYGFFCDASLAVTGHDQPQPRRAITSMFLLKLHGSMNWRIKYGQSAPYGADGISHLERWWHPDSQGTDLKWDDSLWEFIETDLEPQPFMVPPVLAKTALTEQPILRLLWSRAYETLRHATKVTFVGYSLPVTDIAAATLFRESLARLQPTDVSIVDYASPEGQEDKITFLLNNYRSVFPGLTADRIDLSGGLKWAESLLKGQDTK